LYLALLGAVLGLAACGRSDTGTSQAGGQRPLVIGVSFETLQTEFWVAGNEAIKAEGARRGYQVLEAVADGDSSRQLEQVRSFVTRGVDGIVMVPKDGKTCLPAIKAANAAGIPVVLFNRPADPSDARSVAIVADNESLTRITVDYLVGEARKSGARHKAIVLLGDLGDINAIGRRDGFEAAVREAPGVVDVVARVPTEWNQEKAQAGVVNALQAHPDVSLIYTCSDFLLPSIVSALKNAGKYHKTGQPGHVLLGGFDGDATAYRMLEEGYLDATGVQDVYFEASQSVQAIVDLRAGKILPDVIRDPGFVIHQGNLAEMAPKMWGAQVARAGR
jgi:inositol transport system substrate-binding protein